MIKSEQRKFRQPRDNSLQRKLQPLLEEADQEGKPNMATEFWAKVAVNKAIERAAHILDLIDARWPAEQKTRSV